MKVVIYHDWLTGFRGGERVLEAICELFPEAPLYTLVYSPGTTSQTIENRTIHTSFLNKLPKISEHYRKWLPLFPIAVDSMQVKEECDLVISSSHCVIKGLQKPVNAKHLCYIHSPMRYIYDQFPVYFGKDQSVVTRLAAHLVRPYLQRWDYWTNDNVDQFVANSNFVAKRISNLYFREAAVIHPFVELDDFNQEIEEKDNYFIMLSAFAPNKRVDLAIEAFNQLGWPLKIIGQGQMEKLLKSMAGPTIEFLGSLPRNQVVHLLSKARGFIFPGIEDFGITPLEALASGTPVVAYHAGGVLETLNNEVAEFFYHATSQSLVDALRRFEQRNFSTKALKQVAQLFSKEQFKQQLNNQINFLMAKV